MSHGFFAAMLMIYLPAQLTDEREKEMVGDIILLALGFFFYVCVCVCVYLNCR